MTEEAIRIVNDYSLKRVVMEWPVEIAFLRYICESDRRLTLVIVSKGLQVADQETTDIICAARSISVELRGIMLQTPTLCRLKLLFSNMPLTVCLPSLTELTIENSWTTSLITQVPTGLVSLKITQFPPHLQMYGLTCLHTNTIPDLQHLTNLLDLYCPMLPIVVPAMTKLQKLHVVYLRSIPCFTNLTDLSFANLVGNAEALYSLTKLQRLNTIHTNIQTERLPHLVDLKVGGLSSNFYGILSSNFCERLQRLEIIGAEHSVMSEIAKKCRARLKEDDIPSLYNIAMGVVATLSFEKHENWLDNVPQEVIDDMKYTLKVCKFCYKLCVPMIPTVTAGIVSYECCSWRCWREGERGAVFI